MFYTMYLIKENILKVFNEVLFFPAFFEDQNPNSQMKSTNFYFFCFFLTYLILSLILEMYN